MWHLIRTMALWVVGLLGSAHPGAEDAGSWSHVLGWALVGVAIVDSVALYRREQVPSGARARNCR